MSEKDTNFNIMNLFEEKKLVKICAPMVRYSKLQFRNLVRMYDCDLAFTPMILADSFCLSEKARRNEFTTNLLDTPLITQFAANTVHDFVGAAHIVSPYCNGVDLNCGCPQRWAKEQGLGCVMLKRPEQIYDIVRQCRNQISKPFTISVKMRLLNDLKETISICKQLEMCGVSFFSVHARTASQLTGDINRNALKLIKENCHIPLVANGGVTSLENCCELYDETGCDGVMIANALLANPTLFSGSTITTVDCVQNWLNICYNSTLTCTGYEKEMKNPTMTIPEKPNNLTFQCFHHHLVFMIEKVLLKKQRQIFNNLRTFSDVLDFIEDCFEIRPQLYEPKQFLKVVTLDTNYENRDEVYRALKPPSLYDCEDDKKFYDYEGSNGKYFMNKVSIVDVDNSECDWSNMFLENG